MKKIIMLLMFILLLSPHSALAQEKHPIDKFEEEEIAKDSTTSGMNIATAKAMEKWDTEMNKYYKLLMSILDKDSKAILKSAQIEWIKFRDLEFRNIANIFGKIQGTMYTTMHVASKNEIVKRRALDLKEYYELLKDK
jgi:uncharacterized protein YecT (DUF1311 family)